MSRLICRKYIIPISYLATAMEQGSEEKMAVGEQCSVAQLPLRTALL